MRSLAWILLAALLSAGCVDREGLETQAAPAGPDTGSTAAIPPLTQPVTVALRDTQTGGTIEFSNCRMGEGPPISRQPGGLIRPGSDHLVIDVETRETTSMRVGYSLDGGEPTWFDVVLPGQSATFTVPVSTDAFETTVERWVFHYQPNLPQPLTQDCYTGASISMRVQVQAMPGPA